MPRIAWMSVPVVCLLSILACSAPALSPPSATLRPTNPPVTNTSAVVSSPTSLPTATSAPTALPPSPTPQPPTAQPTPTEPPIETYMAYVQNQDLLVTHVLAGQPLDTKTYIHSEYQGGLYNLGWSPSGQYLAFNLFSVPFSHLYFVDVQSGADPVDLGIANDWAWSSDSKLLAFEHEYELWVFSSATGQSRALTTHLGINWLWSKPVFTPTDSALIAAGTDSNHMDRNGNTPYKLYRVPLDGSAAHAYPPGNLPAITEEINGRLPLALRFSPDGQKLAIITSQFFSTCAIVANYNVANADGSNLLGLSVPSLASFGGPDQKMYFFGDSLVWTPESDGLWLNSLVRDCGPAFTVVGGPQISRVSLDGQEHEIIPGEYGQLSLDHSGSLLGVVNLAGIPHVQILGRDGHLVLDLGEGDMAALQP